MPAKLTLAEFAKMLADHKTKDLIEMLYNKMSDDELMEMAEENDAEKCIECEEIVEDEHGWRDSKMRLYCDDCKYEADNQKYEECPGDEADYDYEECCDSACNFKGHWFKKTDGRTDEDEEERKWASYFVEKAVLSS